MTTNLPLRPDLGHLKRQAKNLLKAQQRGDADACPILRQLHRFGHASDAHILTSEVKLNEVQFALALDYGFSSWNALKEHVERLAIKADEVVVHRRDGEVWIDGVAKLSWSDPGACTFIGALLRALNRVGEPINYPDLMGLSGAAFRFCFAHPNWDWSSVDGMLSFDAGQFAMDALGYEAGWAEEDEMRAAFMKSIDEGRPAMGIDLVRAAEWGVITGYADEGRTLLCRTYFDDPGDDYMRTERLPWLNYMIGERKPAPARHASLLASLRVAVMVARGEGFVSSGGCSYKRGIEGLETWIADLLDGSRFDPRDADGLLKYASINRFIFDALLDAREAAARYLASHSEVLGPDLRSPLVHLAGIYGQIVAALRECAQYVPKEEGLDPHDWTPDIRLAQVDALRTVVEFEREALRVCEQILSSAA
jgi:hypothetical protein